MLQVTIREWRNKTSRQKEEDLLSQRNTSSHDIPTNNPLPEYWWGQLECKEKGLGLWVLESFDLKDGIQRKQGE